MSSQTKGVLLMLAASFLFAVMFALPKLADAGLNGVQATFLRYVTGFLTILPLAYVTLRRGGTMPAKVLPLIALRALCGVTGVTAMIYATTHMAYADAMAIGFTDGVFVLALAALVLGERVTAGRWMAAIVCLLGAVIVAQPSPEFLGRVWMEPVAGIAFLGAFIMAVEVTVIKHLTHRVGATILLLYTNGFALLLAAGPALWIGNWPPLGDLAIYALMGPVAIAGQFLFIYSLRCADVSALVPYKYSTLIYAGLLGIVLFGQWPDALTLIGVALIIGAGVRLSRLESRE